MWEHCSHGNMWKGGHTSQCFSTLTMVREEMGISFILAFKAQTKAQSQKPKAWVLILEPSPIYI